MHVHRIAKHPGAWQSETLFTKGRRKQRCCRILWVWQSPRFIDEFFEFDLAAARPRIVPAGYDVLRIIKQHVNVQIVMSVVVGNATNSKIDRALA